MSVNWVSHLGYDDSMDDECPKCGEEGNVGIVQNGICNECDYDVELGYRICKACGEETGSDGYCPDEECPNSFEMKMARKQVKGVLNRRRAKV